MIDSSTPAGISEVHSHGPALYTTDSQWRRWIKGKDGQFYSDQAIAERHACVCSYAIETPGAGPEFTYGNLSTGYQVGTDQGDARHDQFDIDYNQHKCLIETRMSGALDFGQSRLWLVES